MHYLPSGGARAAAVIAADAGFSAVLARGATTVVLSQGMSRQLHVHPDTCRYLGERSITVRVAETREAVKIYNDLTAGVLVAGLFHSTC